MTSLTKAKVSLQLLQHTLTLNFRHYRFPRFYKIAKKTRKETGLESPEDANETLQGTDPETPAVNGLEAS